MSGGQKQTTQSTQSTTYDPQAMALRTANYNTAQQNAGILGSGYSGQLTAPFTPAQIQAQGLLSNVATNPQFQSNIAGATNAAQNVLGNPVNGTVNAQPYNPAQLAGMDLSKYENPYQSDVINATMAQLRQQEDQTVNSNAQGAEAAHAFGNDRLGVQNALTNQFYDQDRASTLAGLNSANFAQAQNAAMGDINSQNQASQFNSSQNVNAQNQSIQNILAANGLTLNAAGQLVNLSNAGLNTATMQGGLLGAVGDAQQAQQQTADTNAYQAFLTHLGLIGQSQNLLNSSLGLIPIPSTTNSNGTTTTTSNPGALGILGALMGGAETAGDLGWAPFAA